MSPPRPPVRPARRRRPGLGAGASTWRGAAAEAPAPVDLPPLPEDLPDAPLPPPASVRTHPGLGVERFSGPAFQSGAITVPPHAALGAEPETAEAPGPSVDAAQSLELDAVQPGVDAAQSLELDAVQPGVDAAQSLELDAVESAASLELDAVDTAASLELDAAAPSDDEPAAAAAVGPDGDSFDLDLVLDDDGLGPAVDEDSLLDADASLDASLDSSLDASLDAIAADEDDENAGIDLDALEDGPEDSLDLGAPESDELELDAAPGLEPSAVDGAPGAGASQRQTVDAAQSLDLDSSSLELQPTGAMPPVAATTTELEAAQSLELDSASSLELDSASSLELDSAQSLELDSAQSLELDSAQSLELDAASSQDLDAESLELDASQSLELDAAQSLELDAIQPGDRPVVEDPAGGPDSLSEATESLTGATESLSPATESLSPATETLAPAVEPLAASGLTASVDDADAVPAALPAVRLADEPVPWPVARVSPLEVLPGEWTPPHQMPPTGTTDGPAFGPDEDFLEDAEELSVSHDSVVSQELRDALEDSDADASDLGDWLEADESLSMPPRSADPSEQPTRSQARAELEAALAAATAPSAPAEELPTQVPAAGELSRSLEMLAMREPEPGAREEITDTPTAPHALPPRVASTASTGEVTDVRALAALERLLDGPRRRDERPQLGPQGSVEEPSIASLVRDLGRATRVDTVSLRMMDPAAAPPRGGPRVFLQLADPGPTSAAPRAPGPAVPSSAPVPVPATAAPADGSASPQALAPAVAERDPAPGPAAAEEAVAVEPNAAPAPAQKAEDADSKASPRRRSRSSAAGKGKTSKRANKKASKAAGTTSKPAPKAAATTSKPARKAKAAPKAAAKPAAEPETPAAGALAASRDPGATTDGGHTMDRGAITDAGSLTDGGDTTDAGAQPWAEDEPTEPRGRKLTARPPTDAFLPDLGEPSVEDRRPEPSVEELLALADADDEPSLTLEADLGGGGYGADAGPIQVDLGLAGAPPVDPRRGVGVAPAKPVPVTRSEAQRPAATADLVALARMKPDDRGRRPVPSMGGADGLNEPSVDDSEGLLPPDDDWLTEVGDD